MAFVPGYQYDVFISYARADDDPLGSVGIGWVSQFAACFESALKMHLSGSKELRLFRDVRDFDPNNQIEELLDTARHSAVFLAVASRSYAARPWTNREIEAFVNNARDTHRLFAIEVLPLEEGRRYPEPLHSHNRMAFYRRASHVSDALIPLSISRDGDIYVEKIHDLAEAVTKQLTSLKQSAESAVATDADAPAAKRSRNCVLLAQVTEDLEEEREQVRRHLEQFDITVLPAGGYRQGADEFKRQFELDLSKASLFVQLLGPFAARISPDLPEGYTRYQLDTALAGEVPILQWRKSDLDPAKISNPEQNKLLLGEAVIASGLESFKALVVERVMAASKPKQVATSTRSSLIFIDADRDDMDIARALQSELSQRKFPASIPMFEESGSVNRADLTENIVDCDALFVIYGQSPPSWVASQLRTYNKLKGERAKGGKPAEPVIVAQCECPPPEKADIPVVLPEVQKLDCRDGFGPMWEVLDKLSRNDQ